MVGWVWLGNMARVSDMSCLRIVAYFLLWWLAAKLSIEGDWQMLIMMFCIFTLQVIDVLLLPTAVAARSYLHSVMFEPIQSSPYTVLEKVC